MRRVSEGGHMQEPRPADVSAEAERYLDVVQVFRAEDCEPHWRVEWGARARSARRPLRRGPLGKTPRRLK